MSKGTEQMLHSSLVHRRVRPRSLRYNPYPQLQVIYLEAPGYIEPPPLQQHVLEPAIHGQRVEGAVYRVIREFCRSVWKILANFWRIF